MSSLSSEMRSNLEQESRQKKYPYPKAVFFIIGNEFCERFCYYGLRTILFLYLKNVLQYSKDDSTAINHGFMFLSYFFPLMGALLADSYLGKYRTILILSLVYSLGCVVLSLGSVANYGIPARELSLLGLLLIAIGTGGIKPCVSAFGGDQFRLPEQEKQLATFFSIFYFSINLGSVASSYLTPILKKDVQCLDSTTCYPLAFGVPSILMIFATVIFIMGKSFYIMSKPGRNIILEVINCVKHAVAEKLRIGKHEKKGHWLDYANDKFDETLISDIKAVMGVLHMFLPVPIFWALYDQQTSRWIAQAESMNGQLGSYYLLPEQMQALNPFLVLMFIPVFDYVIYPVLTKLGLLTKPLQRLGAGGILAAIAFIVSAMVELKVESTYATLAGPGEAQLRIFNSFNCPVTFTSAWTNETMIGVQDARFFLNIKATGETFETITAGTDCTKFNLQFSGNISITERESTSYIIVKEGQNLQFKRIPGFDQIQKALDQSPVIRVVYSVKEKAALRLVSEKTSAMVELLETQNIVQVEHLKHNSYDLIINGEKILENIEINNGGVYTILISDNGNGINGKVLELTPANTIHILWQLPQIIIITLAEVMFSITGLQFAFTQAPISMKSVVASLWLLTTAFGNVIVAIVAESHLFKSQVYELLLFAGLMLADMIFFIFLAVRYKYKTFN